MKDTEGGATPIGGSGGSQPATPERRPAPSEEQRWQALLEEAESEIADLEARVAELESALERTRLDAERQHQTRALEQALARAGVIDAETAGLLLAPQLAADTTADIDTLVRDLRGRKPFLFAPPARPAPNAAMGPGTPVDDLSDLATTARHSGDRAALLRYLRRRRSN
jgi:hypothetical protein